MNKAIVLAAFGLLAFIGPLSLAEENGKSDKAKLPSYVVDVVTDSQKKQIRDIQDKYAKQIADLQAQIDALTKQSDTEIDNLLNADQRAKVKKARDEAAAKKKAAEKIAEESKAKGTKSLDRVRRSIAGRQ
jgi:RNA-binding protein YhbY